MPETVDSLLDIARQSLSPCSDSPQLDAEVLLCHCLDKPRSFLRAWPEYIPSPAQGTQFQQLLQQRIQGMPIAYLIGEREFWSRRFIVCADVLIPRPDTELLIELCLSKSTRARPAHILDLGTGSGILAITLAAEIPSSKVLATDICPKALQVAKHNAGMLQVQNVDFIESNWFSGITSPDFDLIVSNPPYLASDDPHLQQGDLRFEPKSALISADNGLKDIRHIAEQARRYLKPDGELLIEHGWEQQEAVQTIFNTLNYQHIHTHLDLSGHPRVTTGIWKPQ